ncbi:MAG: UpxY family transcription antiterminator [Acidobacteriota bacterium]
MAEWFALSVRHQHEKTVAFHLARLDLETCLPLYRTRRAWSDRQKELDLPLFAGYVFCHVPLGSHAPILNLPGVHSFVGFGRGPTPIPDAEIDALKTMVASQIPVHPWPFLQTGQRVRIDRGPLRNLEGILVEVKDSWRVVVSVELLQRSVAAEVDRMCVSPAGIASARVGIRPRAA